MTVWLLWMSKKVKKKYFFMHIPKSAGMSIRRMMVENELNTLVVDDYSQLAYLSDSVLQSYDAVTGHLGFRLLNRFPDAFSFTILRDPVDRILSMYGYWRATNFSYDARQSLKGGLTEFLESPHEGARMEIDNGQTWQAAVDRAPWMRAVHSDTAPETLLRIAKDNLLRMDFVGLYENFDKDVIRLGVKLGWRNIGIPNENVTPRKVSRRDCSQNELNRILSLNELDLALYEFAKEMSAQGYWERKAGCA